MSVSLAAPPPPPLWGFEETAVLAMRRYAAALGVDLVALAVELSGSDGA